MVIIVIFLLIFILCGILLLLNKMMEPFGSEVMRKNMFWRRLRYDTDTGYYGTKVCNLYDKKRDPI